MLIDRLDKITLTVENADTNKRDAQVTGGLAVVTGKNAQSTGIDRQAFMEAEFGTEIGNQVISGIDKFFKPGVDALLVIGVECGQYTL